MEKLKSSSSSSVANEKFSDFNNYMHTVSDMDDLLANIVNEAGKHKKSLVLVCGNSGAGKSHLIARLKEQGIIDHRYEVCIDATSADKKGMKANDKLREKLLPLSDNRISDDSEIRLIIAINLGILNDFLKNYEDEFSLIRKYVDDQGLFDNIPAWKYAQMDSDGVLSGGCFIGHVDFASFHRYEITPDGLDLQFINGLLNKIVANDEKNEMRKTYESSCKQCAKRFNCPVFWNYEKLVSNEKYREYVVETLAAAIIRHNISPSVREINNFFYEIIIGNTFDEGLINSNSIFRLKHFISNLTVNLLYEGTDGLLAYIAERDILNDSDRSYDKDLISLNLKPSFEKWIKEDASVYADEFKQIETDVIYCQRNLARDYRQSERAIKRDVFKYYLRLKDIDEERRDSKYEKYLKYLYAYNIGDEQKCKDLINLIKDSIYVWNGRLVDEAGSIIKNAVIMGKGTERYYLYKKIDVQFQVNKSIIKLTGTESLPNFSLTLRFNFILKDKPGATIPLDVDYELFELLTEMGNGYVLTDNDRKHNVNFDAFVRTILSKTDSELFVYSRYEAGKTYKIAKDEFGGYVFENEG
jgi:DNA phosphorothioation-dependent restriction protein DptF